MAVHWKNNLTIWSHCVTLLPSTSRRCLTTWWLVGLQSNVLVYFRGQKFNTYLQASLHWRQLNGGGQLESIHTSYKWNYVSNILVVHPLKRYLKFWSTWVHKCSTREAKFFPLQPGQLFSGQALRSVMVASTSSFSSSEKCSRYKCRMKRC